MGVAPESVQREREAGQFGRDVGQRDPYGGGYGLGPTGPAGTPGPVGGPPGGGLAGLLGGLFPGGGTLFGGAGNAAGLGITGTPIDRRAANIMGAGSPQESLGAGGMPAAQAPAPAPIAAVTAGIAQAVQRRLEDLFAGTRGRFGF